MSDSKKTAAEERAEQRRAEQASDPERGGERAAETRRPAAGDRPLVGESSDPEIHRLLAVRQAHQTRLAELEPDDEARREAEESLREVDEELAERGFQR
jgi:hypothetical protein